MSWFRRENKRQENKAPDPKEIERLRVRQLHDMCQAVDDLMNELVGFYEKADQLDMLVGVGDGYQTGNVKRFLNLRDEWNERVLGHQRYLANTADMKNDALAMKSDVLGGYDPQRLYTIPGTARAFLMSMGTQLIPVLEAAGDNEPLKDEFDDHVERAMLACKRLDHLLYALSHERSGPAPGGR
jgi:hypothetical protein